MKKIFLSYRRDDSQAFAARLYERLVERYGKRHVFFDVDSIPIGVDFRVAIERHLSQCSVFLAIIGKEWTGSTTRPRRIHDSTDHVRIEVEMAIELSKPIIPVYCNDETRVNKLDLPVSLYALLYANDHVLDSGRDFNVHIHRLCNEVDKYLAPTMFSYFIFQISRFVRCYASSILICCLLGCLLWYARNPIGRGLLTPSGFALKLESYDPQAFSKSVDGTYQVSRALVDRSSLAAQTDFSQAIRGTKNSFDVFAITGSAFFAQAEAIHHVLESGSRIRILLIDHSDLNQSNVENLFRYSGAKSGGEQWNQFQWSQTQSIQSLRSYRVLQQVAKSSKAGSIELKWFRGPFLNSFWVRDGGASENAIAHVELTYYGDTNADPSFRFGRLSPLITRSLQDQFDYLWNSAHSIPPVEP
jgi:hypothetical protein